MVKELLFEERTISNRPQLFSYNLPNHFPQIVFSGIGLQASAQRFVDQRLVAAPACTRLVGPYDRFVQHDGDAVLAELLRQRVNKLRLADIF